MASKEYLLAKYLSPGDDLAESVDRKQKKKKKKQKAPVGATVGIVDEDADDAWKSAGGGIKETESDLEELYGDATVEMVFEGESDDDEDSKKPMFKRAFDAGDSDNDDARSGNERRRSVDNGGRGMKRRHDSDSEDDGKGRVKRESASPPARQRARHDSDREGDRSPPRKRHHDSRSPSRSRSPPRRRRHDSRSSSRTPPRRRHDSRSPSPKREDSPGRGSSNNGPRMLDGSAAGLQRAADLRKEAESRKAAQMSRLAAFSTEESGRNATTIYRDKSGRKVDIAARKAEDLAEQRKRDAEEASRMVWGQGVAQHRQMEANAERLAREGGKPFARYVDDVDMNEEMMERDRWGDPMAGKVSKKKKVQRPLYKGPPAPPNRFGILPGYRWDGVLRDNGFEKKLFEARNDKLVQDETAYRWGAEDM